MYLIIDIMSTYVFDILIMAMLIMVMTYDL